MASRRRPVGAQFPPAHYDYYGDGASSTDDTPEEYETDDNEGQDDGERGGGGRGSGGLIDWKIPNTRNPQPPWHMWGSSEIVTTPPSTGIGAGAVQEARSQLAKISYKRPESWHFMFATRLIAVPNPTVPGFTNNVIVVYDVTLGIGRTVILLPDFETHIFDADNPGTFQLGTVLRTTSAVGVRRRSNLAGVITTTNTEISEVVAQEINVSARVFLLTSAVGIQATVECSAMFSPKSHIRPEWYMDAPPETQFPGAEQEGGR